MFKSIDLCTWPLQLVCVCIALFIALHRYIFIKQQDIHRGTRLCWIIIIITSSLIYIFSVVVYSSMTLLARSSDDVKEQTAYYKVCLNQLIYAHGHFNLCVYVSRFSSHCTGTSSSSSKTSIEALDSVGSSSSSPHH